MASSGKNVSIHENKQMISNGAPQKWGTEIYKNGFHMLLMNGARSYSVLRVSEQCPNSLPDSGLRQWTKSTMKQEIIRELEDTALFSLETILGLGILWLNMEKYETEK